MSLVSTDDQVRRIEDNIAKEVIETVEFQRLLGIHQLGPIRKVFSQITHTRFEHSIGVYWEAHDFLATLEKNSDIVIDDLHKTCVKLAGLLHDVGHGPYSHCWERVMENSNHHLDYEHEDVSAEVVNEIFKRLELSHITEDHNYGVALIQALVKGTKEDIRLRDTHMEFIFDIVNNKTSAIDVDRLDYLNRDWNHCRHQIRIPGVDVDSHLENVRKLFDHARVSPDGRCVQFFVGDIEKINSMFELRSCFHEHIYQRFETRILEDILLEMIKLRTIFHVPCFLLFDNITSYVRRNYCFDPLNEQMFEHWLKDGNDRQLKRLLNAFNNFNRHVEIVREPDDGFKLILIKYEYRLPETIKNCLHGNISPSCMLIDNLKMEYKFTRSAYYRIREI